MEPFKYFYSFKKGVEWKSVRSIITTTFTGAKLKEVKLLERNPNFFYLEIRKIFNFPIQKQKMTKLIEKCSNSINDHLEKIAVEDKDFEVKE